MDDEILNSVKIFNLLLDILRHIKDVEQDVKDKSLQAATVFGDALNNASIAPSDELLRALQYQDIISQQLSATTDAIDAVEKGISLWLHTYNNDSCMLQDGLVRLDEKLKLLLEQAKQKKAAFSGKSNNAEDEIEFF